jgi:hypothetical protein
MSSIKSRKISRKAADAIADKFRLSTQHYAEWQECDTIQSDLRQKIKDTIRELAIQSDAYAFWETLPPHVKRKQFMGDVQRDHVRFKVVVSVEESNLSGNWSEEYDAEGVYLRNMEDLDLTNPHSWWWFSTNAVALLNEFAPHCPDELELNLSDDLEEKMTNHPVAVAYLQCQERKEELRRAHYKIFYRIRDDIEGKSVKSVIEAWPELTEFIEAYYEQSLTASQLTTPLSQVISEVTKPMITQAAE